MLLVGALALFSAGRQLDGFANTADGLIGFRGREWAIATIRDRRLGSSGLKVSVVGLGTNNFGRRLEKDASVRVVHAALDRGITFIDTSNDYARSEEFMGSVLADRREQFALATKVGCSMVPAGDHMEIRETTRARSPILLQQERVGLPVNWTSCTLSPA